MPRDNEAMKAYQRRWYRANKERAKARDRAWRRKNRARVRVHELKHYYKYHALNLEKARARRLRLKLEMITAYGGKCVCCGEAGQEFLTLDHVNGGGTKERRENRNGSLSHYYHFKRLGWPKDAYRLLCANCNFAFGHYGYCPHEALRELAG